MPEILYKYLIILILTALNCGYSVQAQPVGKPVVNSSIDTEINKLKKDSALTSASWGVCVIRVKDQKMIAAFDPDRLLIPASSQKILTTWAAWSLLGKDYRFTTTVETDGHVEDSLLKGNIYIRGGGDPGFGSTRFEPAGDEILFQRTADTLIRLGVHSIRGTVIADGSRYAEEAVPGSWIWRDIGNYYGTGVNGLNIGENSYTAVFRPGKNPGDSAKLIRIDPPFQGVSIENHVMTGAEGSGDRVILYGAPGMPVIRMQGTVPGGVASFPVRGALPEPDLIAARALHKKLSIADIVVGEEAVTLQYLQKRGNYVNPHRDKLLDYHSPPLSDYIAITHEKSINLYAEAFVRELSLKGRYPGSLESGLEQIIRFWKTKGLDPEGLKLEDGSGLSVLNRVTCRQLTLAMLKIAQEDKSREFIRTLNLAGESGNLKQFLKNSPAASNLRAKSGYMGGVRAYTGIVNNADGDELVFTVIVNHYEGSAAEMKSKLERLLASFAEYSGKPDNLSK